MKWEVTISDDMQRDRLVFHFYKEIGLGRTKIMTPMIKEGRIIWTFVDCEEGEIMPVSFEIPRVLVKKGFMDTLITALYDLGARKLGGDGEEVVNAMKDHLSDLKSLVFGSDKILIERSDRSADI